MTQTQADTKNDRKINESEPSTSKMSDKPIDLEEENEVDGGWKTDSDKIYLFARNDPEKELWFHRLNLATAFDMTTEETINKKNKNVEERNKFHKAFIAYIHNIHESFNYQVLTDNQKNKEVSILIFTVYSINKIKNCFRKEHLLKSMILLMTNSIYG